jgi:hypothetical protein
MENIRTQLTRSIMRRVYIVWLIKKVLSPFWVKTYILVALFWQLSNTVSVVNIFNNAPGLNNLGKNITFALNAFAGAEPIVQLYVALGGTIAFLLFATTSGLIERRHNSIFV